MKKEAKINASSIVVFAIWLLILGLTGVVYYSYVYGGNNSKVVGVHAASDYIDKDADKDILDGKVIVGVGDSIMKGSGTENRMSLTGQVAEKHNMRYQDFSRGGATVISSKRDKDDLTLNILEQVKLLVKEVDHTDYILLNGGTNDAVAGIYNKIGTVTEDFDSKRDTSTFCGAFEEIIATLKDKYPNAAIVYVRVHCMDRRDYKRQLVVGEEAMKICDKWGVGCANVFDDSDFNTYLDRYRAYTFKTKKHPKGDMVHPTLEGYKLFYIPYIEEAYKGLVLKGKDK